jgi:predicted DNA-binding protein YlxM (UPF0122 family)
MATSWYVEQLFLNRNQIRTNIEYTHDMNKLKLIEDSILFDFNDNAYSDLLSAELTLKELTEKDLLSEREIQIFNLLFAGELSFMAIAESLRIDKRVVYNDFKEVCNRVAFALGAHFTNEGYLEYLINKYNFTEEQIDKIKIKFYSRRNND